VTENQESPPLVISAKRSENGTIQISFDSGSTASAFWLTDEEALELVDELMSTVHPTK